MTNKLSNRELYTFKVIDSNFTIKNENVKQEISASDKYGQDYTEETQPEYKNKEQTAIEDGVDNFEIKTGSYEDSIIKDENLDTKDDENIMEDHHVKKEINEEFIIKNDNDDKFECESCDLTFNAEIKLNQHTFRCKMNNRSVKIVDQIQNDNESDDSIESSISTKKKKKPYKCDFCQKTFGRKDNLNRHERFHRNEKPYECDVCKKIFSQKANLNQHKLIHTVEKPYKCDICEKKFGRKSNLIQHTRIHTGEKPFECDICIKALTDQKNLENHLDIHIGH